MTTEAQKRAVAKYDAENTTRVTFKVNKNTEAPVLMVLGKQENKQGFIKSAILEKYGKEVGFKYGMRVRGFSPGAQPKPGLKRREDDPAGKYFDIIYYDRPLSRAEIEDYQLDDLN